MMWFGKSFIELCKSFIDLIKLVSTRTCSSARVRLSVAPGCLLQCTLCRTCLCSSSTLVCVSTLFLCPELPHVDEKACKSSKWWRRPPWSHISCTQDSQNCFQSVIVSLLCLSSMHLERTLYRWLSRGCLVALEQQTAQNWLSLRMIAEWQWIASASCWRQTARIHVLNNNKSKAFQSFALTSYF